MFGCPICEGRQPAGRRCASHASQSIQVVSQLRRPPLTSSCSSAWTSVKASSCCLRVVKAFAEVRSGNKPVFWGVSNYLPSKRFSIDRKVIIHQKTMRFTQFPKCFNCCPFLIVLVGQVCPFLFGLEDSIVRSSLCWWAGFVCFSLGGWTVCPILPVLVGRVCPFL